MVIPQSVTVIGEYAFAHCTNLQTVQIPDRVTEIGESAFGYCANLRKIALPGIQKISSRAFFRCKNLAEVVMPEERFLVAPLAFGGCKKLKFYLDKWGKRCIIAKLSLFKEERKNQAGNMVFV